MQISQLMEPFQYFPIRVLKRLIRLEANSNLISVLKITGAMITDSVASQLQTLLKGLDFPHPFDSKK